MGSDTNIPGRYILQVPGTSTGLYELLASSILIGVDLRLKRQVDNQRPENVLFDNRNEAGSRLQFLYSYSLVNSACY